MIKVGIIGGAGYTAGELIRVLVNHPEVEIVFVNSESNAGNSVTSVHSGLIGDTDLVFTDKCPLEDVDVVFLCSGHGKSAAFWQKHDAPEGLRIIDLAQDFRDESDGYVYGLPEWQLSKIQGTTKVANPGCFATAIQLALLPLAAAGLICDEVQVTAITGSTGAGVKPGATTHFSWRSDNVSTYKVFEHQHLIEICRNLTVISAGVVSSENRTSLDSKGDVCCSVQPVPVAGVPSENRSHPRLVRGGTVNEVNGGAERSEAFSEGTPAPEAGAIQINFVPVRGDFARGIFASVYTKCDLSEEDAVKLYKEYYKDAPFTFVSDNPVDLKQVVNTNKCIVHVEKHGDKLVISSVIDNLLKGASGQAVQNMNIIFGLDQTTGLRLKASAF